MDIFAELNNRQCEAVRHLKGPLLVVAGAGSGKTRVLTHRVAHFIECGVKPYHILAVTFTNKAAGEMRSRVEKLLSSVIPSKAGTSMPFIGTFHSMGVRILRVEMEALGRDRNFTIFDAVDARKLTKQILKDLNLDPKKYTPPGIMSHISGAKNALVTPDEYEQTAENTYQETVGRVFREYQTRLLSANAVDFDDLIVLPVQLFQEFPDILEKYQERWQFISIDEYQDTNHAQYLLAKLLAEKYRNICAIGDSDQAIYSFRGADIRNILEFEESYPDAKIIKLEQNYRSTEHILNGADGVVDHNVSRVKKAMFTTRRGGEFIRIWTAADERDEADMIFRRSAWLTKHEDYKPSDIVILYRTNAQSRVLEEAALRHGVPYQIVGGIRFYERAEIKDLLAYLRFILNGADTVSFERIINTPPRRIGGTTQVKILNFARQREVPVGTVLEHIEMSDGITAGTQRVLREFSDVLRSLRAIRPILPAGEFLQKVIEKIGFKSYLQDGTMEGENRWENVQELISVAQKYDHVGTEDSLPLFLEEVALISDLDQVDDTTEAITLMTLHAAKGLEFPVVFIAGLEENIFPHSRSLFEPADLEEERRLMYVGMTRAKDLLYLVSATQRLIYGSFSSNLPSRFLQEIPEHCIDPDCRSTVGGKKSDVEEPDLRYTEYEDEWSTPEYHIRDRVEHPQFGKGEIVNIEGDILSIDFGTGQVRRFAASIAPLRKREEDVVEL